LITATLNDAITISAFVVMLMLVVEYLNVFTAGKWQRLVLDGGVWRQYAVAAFLGAIPGCIGPWVVVAMYSHGLVSLGAVVAAMVATSGDESFVMLAMIPRQGVLLFAALFLLGMVVGVFADSLARRRKTFQPERCEDLVVHTALSCEPYPRGHILEQWRECSAVRGLMTVILALLLTGAVTGQLGTAEWIGIRIGFGALCAAAIFIVGTVPDHFLTQHLWRHVVRKHGLRIFLWTLAALLVMHLLIDNLELGPLLAEGKWYLLLAACLLGLIPESGPHLVFVTLYAKGAIPLSVLVASSIVQDGHGMLPLLAESRRAFVITKAINLAAGLAVGAALLAIGA